MFFFSCITVTLRVLLFTWRFNPIRQVATGSTTEFYFLGSTCFGYSLAKQCTLLKAVFEHNVYSNRVSGNLLAPRCPEPRPGWTYDSQFSR